MEFIDRNNSKPIIYDTQRGWQLAIKTCKLTSHFECCVHSLMHPLTHQLTLLTTMTASFVERR